MVTGDLETLVNAAYTDPCYKGQTALHFAIERRTPDYVKLLVQNGADLQAKANGTFFQRDAGQGFYFGELPLSLAACTNQPDVVDFLMVNPYKNADPADTDSEGNTVLHTLVAIADDTAENTDMVVKMYDKILVRDHKLNKGRKDKVQLESVENDEGLTPLKLAAKLGKTAILKHMLSREFTDEETRTLSRKFTRWVYGPVCSSLYDISSIDTDEENSVLEIIVFGSDKPNRPEMLQTEPLQSLLHNKWKKFASKLFLGNFLCYMLYLAIFTWVALDRRDGQPPFPLNDGLDYLRSVGEVVVVLGAVRFLYKSISLFKRNPPKIRTLFMNGFSDILLGSKQLGIYNVMMQRMILGDLLQFLCIYSVMLFGFASAVVALITSPSGTAKRNSSLVPSGFKETDPGCKKQSDEDVRYVLMELFKFTIGMGDLEFTDHVQYKAVFHILLICYIVLTYILMLNMLIALMGNTVEKISEQSENLWNLQRAFAILEMERTLPRFLRTKLHSKVSETVSLNNQDTRLKFIKVTERNWTNWRSHLTTKPKEPRKAKMSHRLWSVEEEHVPVQFPTHLPGSDVAGSLS